MPEIDALSTGKKVGNTLDETLKIGGGATTATTPTTTIPRDDAGTNTAPTLLRLQRTSSGTPANGIGAGIDFEVETTAANNEIGVAVRAVATDVTAGSEDFDLVFYLMVAGAAVTELYRMKSTGRLVVGGAAGPQFSNPGGEQLLISSTAGSNFAFLGHSGGVMTNARMWGWAASATDPVAAHDTAFARKAAGVSEANNGTKGSYTGSAFGSGSQTVAQLPAAATAGAGARSCVTDATATTFLSTVAGGGANIVPVMSNGTNWVIG